MWTSPHPGKPRHKYQNCHKHNPHIIAAAEYISGCPKLENKHRSLTIGEMAQKGAIAVGEVEEMTIRGVLNYLPKILFQRTGKKINPMTARQLQQEILGDLENIPEFDSDKVQEFSGLSFYTLYSIRRNSESRMFCP
jgi:hypothetical protein